jgi:hypothetical protein
MISDFERLMDPVAPTRSTKVGRNELCPCGSRKKYHRGQLRRQQPDHAPVWSKTNPGFCEPLMPPDGS